MTDLLVYPNSYRRRLKSSSAIRRLPLNVLLQSDELQFVHQWLEIRLAEPATNGKSPLLTKSATSSSQVNDQDLFDELRLALKQELRDESVVVHHLRDSFLQNHLLKLLIRDDIKLKSPLAFLGNNLQEEVSRQKYSDDLFLQACPGTQKLFSGAVLIGHADIDEGFLAYFHLTDWLLGYYLRHSANLPKLSAKAFEQITGLNKSRCHELANQQDGLTELVRLQANNFALKHPLQPDMSVREPKPKKQNGNSGDLPDFGSLLAQAQLLNKNSLAESIHQQLKRSKKSIETLKHAETFYLVAQKLSITEQKNCHRLAKMLTEAYVSHGHYFQFVQPDDVAKVIQFLGQLGWATKEMQITAHASRFLDDQKKVRALRKFQKIAEQIKEGPACRIKGINSCARIRVFKNKEVEGRKERDYLAEALLLFCRLFLLARS